MEKDKSDDNVKGLDDILGDEEEQKTLILAVNAPTRFYNLFNKKTKQDLVQTILASIKQQGVGSPEFRELIEERLTSLSKMEMLAVGLLGSAVQEDLISFTVYTEAREHKRVPAREPAQILKYQETRKEKAQERIEELEQDLKKSKDTEGTPLPDQKPEETEKEEENNE